MQSWNLIDMALPLKSWTRNVPFPEGADLVCLAEGGLSVGQWRARAEAELGQVDASYRQTLVRLIGRMFVDMHEDEILETPFLRLLKDAKGERRTQLFFARYALAHPWCLLAARRLILPRIQRWGADAEISLAEWDAFVSNYIEDGASEASRRKTRSTVIGVFQQFGVVVRQARSTAPTMLRRGQPDGVVFGWMVADQLASQLLVDRSEDWCVAHSDAAELFALSREQGAACLAAAIQHGELVSTETDGAPSFRAADDYVHASTSAGA